MKTGRNDPCPCGSGKKYKKCCYLTDQTVSASNPEESLIKEQARWPNALNNIRKFTLDKKPHIKEYYKIRKMHSEIMDAMIQYYEDNKFKQTISESIAPSSGGDHALHLIGCNFDLETREGSQGFYDILIYKMAPNTNCITEEFIQSRRYRKPEKIKFLQSMLDSKLGLFEITEVNFDEGYACLKEVFTGAVYTITDIGLSGSQNYGEFYLYTRIITYQDISFGAGLNLIFTKNDEFIQKHIRHHRKNYTHNGEFLRFSQLYNRYSKYPDKIHIVTNSLK